MATEVLTPSLDHIEVKPVASRRAARAASRIHVPDEDIRAAACGSAIEINYDEEKHSDIIPFLPEWAFGGSVLGRTLNLSRDGLGLLAYSCAHAVVLYDYKTHDQRLLLGHRNAVTAVSSDRTGTWLVSVDAGEDPGEPSSVLVWNLKEGSMHCALPGTPPELGYALVAMSPSGEVVAAVSAGPRQRVYLWRWHPDMGARADSAVELGALGAACALTFSHDQDHVMVTCDKNAAFLDVRSKNLQVGELAAGCPGSLLDSIFQSSTSRAISISTKGYISMWLEPLVFSPSGRVNRTVYCIDKGGLSAITEVDGMVVLGTPRGHIRFYDEDMNILHWYQQTELDAIHNLAFHLDPEVEPDNADLGWVGSRVSFPTVRLSVDAEQRGVRGRIDLSRLLSGPSPRAGSQPSQQDPADHFRTRDLIVSTVSGCMVLVSFAHQRCVVLQDSQDQVTAIQTHTEKPQLLLGRANGSISLIDYDKKEIMVTYTFERKVAITSLKFSPNGLVLACGLANGALHMLHPVLLQPLAAPIHRTRSAIRFLCFSPDSMFLAHSDSSNYVYVYRCESVSRCRWTGLGRRKLHGLQVCCLLFGPQLHGASLFSLGLDLVLVEYDVAHSMSNTLAVTRQDRVEQSGVPSYMTWCPGESTDSDPNLLIATSEFKYKLVDLKTRRLCGTAQGPRLRTPVSIIKTLGGADAKHPATAVYCTNRHLGLQYLLPDGNPFRSIAMMAHPAKILNFVFSTCQEYVFVCGAQDNSVIMWRINDEAVDVIHSAADEGLAPWLLSVEGGRKGWLFKQMQTMFCYSQLLHQGASSTEPRCITDSLPVCELPDIMRALGFYPSQFQITSMITEVLKKHGEYINSTDFVKLYVNHKPIYGISLDQLRDAFGVFAQPTDGGTELVMTKDKFLSILLDKGEALDVDEAQNVFALLLKGTVPMEAESQYLHLLMDRAAMRDKLFHYLPDTITFSYLLETLLGVTRKT